MAVQRVHTSGGGTGCPCRGLAQPRGCPQAASQRWGDKDKKKHSTRAVHNQGRRELTFVFIKRLIKNIEKVSSPFLSVTE